jgi:DNA-binding GntR family transcriptional regulator
MAFRAEPTVPQIHHITKAEAALQALRERIRSGKLAPGQRVEVKQLAAEYEMSLTPIREALRVLSADGLVELHSHRGAVVADDAVGRTDEVWRLRALLEPYAVELAVPNLTEPRLEELERLHARCAPSMRRMTTMYNNNRSWHFAIYEASDQPILLGFIGRLWEMFPWRTVWVIPGRAEVSAQEHQTIMEAIRAGDAALAAERMRTHILSARSTALDGQATEAGDRRNRLGGSA